MSKKELMRSLTSAAFVLVGMSLLYNIINIEYGILTSNILLIILAIAYYTADEIRTVLLNSKTIEVVKTAAIIMIYIVLLIEVITFKI